MQVTDEQAALEAISTLSSASQEQQDARRKIDAILASDDPIVDIQELLPLYNILYFRGILLPRVEASWSTRMTLCAGTCELLKDPKQKGKFAGILVKLSVPLLKFRSRSDVIDTFLHELIHAYLFVTTSWRHSREENGHGAGFLLLADAINNHGGYNVTVFHSFHDEVESYRTHVWQCDGPCKLQAPDFGLVKRTMNRAPGKHDLWWKEHEMLCGGTFVKISEPEPKAKKPREKSLASVQNDGQQRKLDQWFSKQQSGASSLNPPLNADIKERNEAQILASMEPEDMLSFVSCPICGDKVPENQINSHLDEQHNLS